MLSFVVEPVLILSVKPWSKKKKCSDIICQPGADDSPLSNHNPRLASPAPKTPWILAGARPWLALPSAPSKLRSAAQRVLSSAIAAGAVELSLGPAIPFPTGAATLFFFCVAARRSSRSRPNLWARWGMLIVILVGVVIALILCWGLGIGNIGQTNPHREGLVAAMEGAHSSPSVFGVQQPRVPAW